MKISTPQGVLLICAFVVFVLGVAFFRNPHFPVLVIAGENSVGTWLSGTLLIFMAAISLVIGMQQRWYPWLLATIFFLLLSLDERFMFHEQLQEYITFSSLSRRPSRWMVGVPVILGAISGLVLSAALWRSLTYTGRVLLMSAALLGAVSVYIDVTAGGVVWEESFKITAELLMVCALVVRVSR